MTALSCSHSAPNSLTLCLSGWMDGTPGAVETRNAVIRDECADLEAANEELKKRIEQAKNAKVRLSFIPPLLLAVEVVH